MLPSVLPAISSFIKDTINENLKKPLQPAGLFAAAIFLLLNLLFAPRNRFVIWYLGLDAGWQLVLASASVIVLSYLLLSLSSTILKLATGESWADSLLLGRVYRTIQQIRLNAMPKREQYDKKWREVKEAPTERQRSKLIIQLVQYWQKLWEKTTLFSAQQGYVAPTALGNVMNATASYIWQRYRIDMNTMLPYMQLAIKDKDLADRIDQEKATLDFLLNMAFVLVVFSIEYVLLYLSLGELLLKAGLVPLFLLLLAYFGFYRAAVVKAHAWGQAVQMAFELYREELRQTLELREFKSRVDERYVWKMASRWLIWGPERKVVKSAAEFPYDDKYVPDPKKETYDQDLVEAAKVWKEQDSIFGKELAFPSPSLSWDSSDNAEVEVKAVITEEYKPIDAPGNAPNKYVNYVVLVSNITTVQKDDGSTCPAAAEGVYILISDPQVTTIWDDQLSDPEVHGGDLKVTGKRVPAAKKEKQQYNQLWYIDKLPANGTCVLRYRLLEEGFEAKVTPEGLEVKATVQVNPKRILYTFEVTNPNVQKVKKVTLEVFDTRVPPAKLLDCWGDLRKPSENRLVSSKRLGTPVSRLSWDLGSIGDNETVTLEYAIAS